MSTKENLKKQEAALEEEIMKNSTKVDDIKKKAKGVEDKIIVTIPEITREDTGKLTCTLTMKVVESDYMPKVEDVLKSYRKKIKLNGFRKGKAPMAIVTKMYGEGVRADEVQKAMQRAISAYIVDNKIKLFGNPLMKKEDEEKEINWKTEREFEWRFDLGLQPEMKTKVTNKDKFTRYTIKVDDNLVDKYISDIKKKHGVMTSPEEVKDEDIVYCQFQQVDDENKLIPDGVRHVGAVSVKNIKDKMLFLGLKKGEIIWIKPTELTDDINDMARIFNVEVDKMKMLQNSKFAFTVLTINRMIEAEVGQKLFDDVYGQDKIKSEKEFREKIAEDAAKALIGETNDLLYNQVIKYYVEKENIEFPDEFLKEWLLRTTNGQVTEDNLEDSYKRYKTQMSWNLIEQKINIDNNITVSDDEIKSEMEKSFLAHAENKGVVLNPKQMEEALINSMADPKQRRGVYDFLKNDKFISLIRDTCKIKEKEVSYDKFYEIANAEKEK